MRYIPARAGEARVFLSGDGDEQVHPRACGGSGFLLAPRPSMPGTSPRVRGKLQIPGSGLHSHRYIPARAGEATGGNSRTTPAWVHPRACGGSEHEIGGHVGLLGTSPRVRGKPDLGMRVSAKLRYIPARAGEAFAKSRTATLQRVHPRACGGSLQLPEELFGVVGTSPRVRGKPLEAADRRALERYIPARAGEARTPAACARSRAVHPRACGGSPSVACVSASRAGTSPRVRGKRRCR